MPPPRIRAITLDLDESVWPCAPVIEAAEAALLDWLKLRVPRLVEVHDQDGLRAHRRRLMGERPEIAHDATAVRQASLTLLLAEQGLTWGEAQGLAHEALVVFLEHRNRIEPYADSAPALRRLAERFQLISLTNDNSDPELTPLRGIFRHRVRASEVGASKPDPALFRRALALCGCPASWCLHVGDEPYLDIQAAQCLGIGAIWVNRQGRAWPAGLPPPQHQVSDLNQLADWLWETDCREGLKAGDPDGV